MSYFQARSDLHFMREFAAAVLKLWELETKGPKKLTDGQRRYTSPSKRQATIQWQASKIEGYAHVRERVVRGALRANRIARRLGVPIEYTSYPAPAAGGPIIELTVFDATFRDQSYDGVERRFTLDALDQAIGECEAQVNAEFRHLINPIYWVKEVLVFIIRIPFIVIEASGFDVSKVEDHFLGRAFKLLEIIALIAFLVWLGLTREELRQAVVMFLSNLTGGGP